MKVEVKRQIKPTGGEVELGGLELKFDPEGSTVLMDKGKVTGFGYKCMVKTLVDAITFVAKNAKSHGFSEGQIVADAMEMLEANLVDVTIGEAEEVYEP